MADDRVRGGQHRRKVRPSCPRDRAGDGPGPAPARRRAIAPSGASDSAWLIAGSAAKGSLCSGRIKRPSAAAQQPVQLGIGMPAAATGRAPAPARLPGHSSGPGAVRRWRHRRRRCAGPGPGSRRRSGPAPPAGKARHGASRSRPGGARSGQRSPPPPAAAPGRSGGCWRPAPEAAAPGPAPPSLRVCA